MNFRRQRTEDNTINLTPLIDVVFLLLIFFMVTTTFKKERNLVVTLPESRGEAALAEENVLNVIIDRSGTYSINGRTVRNGEVETLMRALGEASKGNNKLPLVILADELTSYKHVIRFMDAAGRLGFADQRMTVVNPTK